MWQFFVTFYLAALMLFGGGWLLISAFRTSIKQQRSGRELLRAMRIRSISYFAIGLGGLLFLTQGYLTATVTLAATAALLIVTEYGISLIAKNQG